ncbi:DUF6428 family protein [uncultured Psychroserpens sp.]|uniref:DUF6428 family protein n=1 Tax=uncultured Psychroserpens sp. TaxID=255436 RepID=UPI002625B722|nr:DUF6428 family protein [uncultured Psychroserpens sp.]
MKTQELFSILDQHNNKELWFEYAPNVFVAANYHITEVKHITVDSVDCGAQTDSWKETIIQLWESPNDENKTECMSVFKAMGILKKVGNMKPYTLDAEVKFEYSNPTFHTAQLFVNDYQIQDNKLILKLAIEKTDCKAKELCGVPETITTESEAPCCSPEGNCC